MTTQEAPRAQLDVAVATRTWRVLDRDRLLVAAFTLLALALRAPNLGRAYWIDEGISVGISSHPLSQLHRLLSQDGSPPLFYVVLHFWIALFGTSEVATHTLPLLVSLAAVPVGYWCGRELFDRKAGVAAAALFATNPFLGWYSTETRMYTMVVVLASLGVTLAWRAVRDRDRRSGALAIIVGAALLYTHDWGIYIVVVTTGVLGAYALSRNDRRLAAAVAGGGAMVAVLWLPWLPTFVEQAKNTAAPWAVQPAIGDFFADPSTALGGTAGIVVVPLLVIGAVWARRQRPVAFGHAAGVIAAIGLLTTLAGFLGAQIEPSWTVRYLAVIVGPLLLAGAGALAYGRRGVSAVVAVSLILAGWSFVGLLLPNPNAPYAKSNVAAVARAVAPRLRSGDVVIVTQTEQLAVLYHYLPAGLIYLTPTGRVTDPSVVNWRNIIARLDKASPCADLQPVLGAVPLGTNILEVDPARTLGASGSAWSHAVNSQVFDDHSFLARDPDLTLIGLYNPASNPRPYSPVDAVLFHKTSQDKACP